MEKNKKRVLVIGAHYDDTAWCWAGLVSLMVKKGIQVDEAVLTDTDYAGIGKIRKQEQLIMMGGLGMGILYAVGETQKFKDGYLNQVNTKVITQAILGILQKAEKTGKSYHTIISFGPDGQTGHPDHKKLSKAVRKAFKDKSNHSVKQLFEVGMSENERKLWGEYFVPIPKNSLNGYKKFNINEVFDKKVKAIKAHKTQYEIPVGGGRAQIKRLNQLPKVEYYKVIYKRKLK